jgi:hypothetical protein
MMLVQFVPMAAAAFSSRHRFALGELQEYLHPACQAVDITSASGSG